MVGLSAPRIGYVPHGPDLKRPMVRRRFPRYAARRGLQFEIVSGWDGRDIIVSFNLGGLDLVDWSQDIRLGREQLCGPTR